MFKGEHGAFAGDASGSAKRPGIAQTSVDLAQSDRLDYRAHSGARIFIRDGRGGKEAEIERNQGFFAQKLEQT